MKRQFLFAAGILLTGSILLIASCSKDDSDTTPPVVTLSGSSSVDVILNSSYSDAGATATDDEDGSVLVSTDNPVNVNSAATYTITYTATDNAGNTGTATRTVRVYNESEAMEGTYITVENAIDTFPQTITASTTINKRIHFSKFANYVNNTGIYADVIGAQIDMDDQTALGIGPSGCTHDFKQQPGGNSIVVNQEKYTFSIKFTDEQIQGGATCPATGAVPYEDVFVQQ